MAPEQVAGDGVDHRADIYAWGVVAWELLAVRHPFASRTTRQAMLAAHLTEPAPPIAEHCAAVPSPLAALVMSCLNKDPDRRPQSAAELLAVLDGVATPVTAPVTRVSPAKRVVIAAAIAVGLALVFWLPPRMRSRHVRRRPHRAQVGDLLGVGFCGGLTTMSTFAVEVAAFARDGRVELAAAYLAASTVAAVAAAWLGATAERRLTEVEPA
jgi:fluoride ion exporter CrcB/FEX